MPASSLSVPRRVTLSAAAVLLLAGAAPTAAQEYRLDGRAEPLSQSVHLQLDPAAETYSGRALIELRLREASDAFSFHAEEMDLDRLVLTRPGHEGSWPLAAEVGEWGTVTARAEETLEAGDYTLEIDFRQELGTRAVGLYRMEQAGDSYLFTQFEPDDARKAFPCWDEPAYKIPYQLTLEVPAGLEALSNTPIARESEAGGVRTVVFEATPPTPSYLLALAVGPLEAVEIPGMSIPGRVLTPKGQSHLTRLAVETTPPILAALERYFGRPYPYAKLDLVAVPEYWPGAMENPGAITFLDQILLLHPERATLAQRRTLARFVAHELAHIWFGDLVTMAWWDDLWLNESFADWMGYKVVETLYPQLALDIDSQGGVQRVMIGDARPSTTPVRKAVASRADLMEDLGLAYAKGMEVLGMIERWIGEDAFRTGVNRYLAEHAWGNAAAEDLWTALSEASGKDLRRPLEGFLNQPGYPLITARVAEADGGARLVLEQERFHNAGVEVAAQQWTVPMTVKLGRAGGAETLSVVFDRPRLEVALGDRPDWVLPNADAVGYYRWRVPEAELLELAEAADRLLSPVERVAFLGNAAALLDAGLLGGDGYLRVLHAFADDPEPQVTSALLGGLGKVRFAFVPDDLQPAFRRYLRTTLGPVAERYGLEPRPGEEETVSLLRPQLVTWLGWVARDAEVVAFARRQAELYLDDPAAVDPAVAGTVLAVAARDGDAELFETLRRRFETATDPTDRARFLGALGAFEAPELRARALVYTLEGPLRTNELFVIPFGYASDTEAGQERVFQWVLAHFDALAERLPPMLIDFMPRIGGGCSPERLQATEEFFGEDPWRTEGTAQTLAKVRDQVHDCIELRRREGAVVQSYLSAGEETGPQPTRRPSRMR